MKGTTLFAIVFLSSLPWSPDAALCAPGQPRLPRTAIPAEVSDDLRNNLLALYSPYPEKRAQAIAALGALAERAAPAVPFLLGMTNPRAPEGDEIKQTLLKVGGAAVDPLLSAVGDPDRHVRSAAAWALGELKDPRAVPALAGLLRDEERLVREEAAAALGKTGGAPAVRPLFGALRDEEVSVRQYAAKALGKIGAPALNEAIALLADPDGDQRRYAAWILGDLEDPRAVEPLAAALLGPADDVGDRSAYETVMALAKIGPAATESLLALAERGNAEVRRAAIHALGTVRELRAVPLLLAALKDADGGIRFDAVEALGRIGDPRAVEPLVPILNDARPGYRIAAAEALAAIGDRRATQPLIVALKDAEGPIRARVAGALGAIKDPRAVAPLCAALRDKVSEVRSAAAEALVGLPDSLAVKPLIAALGDEAFDVRSHAVEALVAIGTPAIGPLLAAARDPGRDVRGGAALALGALKDARAVEPLILLLRDRDSSVRDHAARGLGAIADRRAVEPLVAALQEPPASRAVVVALVALGDSGAVDPLLASLEKSAEKGVGGTREFAQELSKMGEMLVEPLVSRLPRAPAKSRPALAELLGDLKDRRGVGPLVSALRAEDRALQEKAVDALVKIGTPAVEPLLAVVREETAPSSSGRPETLIGAVRALGEIGDPGSGEALAAWAAEKPLALRVDRCAMAVTTALGKIGGPAACRFLVAAIRDAPARPAFPANDVGSLARAIARAECLPFGELLDLVGAFSRNPWVPEAFHLRALEFLAASGETEAASDLTRYRNLVAESLSPTSTLERVRLVLGDRALPFWIKRKIMDRMSSAPPAAKVDLLEVCLALAADVYTQWPEFPRADQEFERWGVAIIGTGNSEGDLLPLRELLEERRRTYALELNPAARAREEALIAHLLGHLRRPGTSRPLPPASPSVAAPATAPPTAPPGAASAIQSRPHPEPQFTSLGSRLGRVELFVFDHDLRWFGLGKADLFLAAVMRKTAETSDGGEKEALHLKALQVVALERKLTDETGRSELPLLMPLPLDRDFAASGMEWSPRSRDVTLALEAGQRRLVLFRGLEKTGVRFRLQPPRAAGPATYQFDAGDLPAGAWVIAEYGPALAPPAVFVSSTGAGLDRRFHLLPDETQREVPSRHDEEEAQCQSRFLAARSVLESYEREALAKAGGPAGIADLRLRLLSRIEELRRGTRLP